MWFGVLDGCPNCKRETGRAEREHGTICRDPGGGAAEGAAPPPARAQWKAVVIHGIACTAATRSGYIPAKGRQTSSLTFHSLCHSFVSALADPGVPAELRQKLSSHADSRSHEKYTHHELEILRGAVAKLPSVVQLG